MRLLVCLSATMLCAGVSAAEPLPRLKVSDNKRFLVTDDGKPFFWLADTAWELFHRLDREEADHYLRTRAAQGYNVVQAVVLAEEDGLRAPNPYGHVPLRDLDPAKPVEDYFAHVDWVVKRANELGITIGMLPTWGDKWGRGTWGVGPEIFTPANAEPYGEMLGRRYKDVGVVWILGGDRNPDKPVHLEITRAMARGLRRGDGGAHLMTFHPSGGRSSAEWFHNDDWLDFNMQQNGHNTDVPVWERIGREYDRKPTKPVLDGEPLYEDHPIGFKPKERGHSNAADVRKFAYSDVFSGACGHTYGHHSVWQCYDAKKYPAKNLPLVTWREAIERPGGKQMKHLRTLMESRPYLTRVPDQSILASDHGGGAKKLVATRCSQGGYVMVYSPAGRAFAVHADKVAGGRYAASWFNPRTGVTTKHGEGDAKGVVTFTPPDEGENLDWVLVLDRVGAK